MKIDWNHLSSDRVTYITEPKEEFEKIYVKVRSLENRIFDDELVKQLPSVPISNKHHDEWAKREFTLNKFAHYLKPNHKTILEVGCGNGWFSNAISNENNFVLGLDVGKKELEQAARCFASNRLKFVCCQDLNRLPQNFFDLIIFNASIQYFDLSKTFWKTIFEALKTQGEVHLLDSPFYKKTDAPKAKKRSTNYYKSIDCKAASDFYHHLIWEKLPNNFILKHKPNSILGRINKKQSPFPWIIVKK